MEEASPSELLVLVQPASSAGSRFSYLKKITPTWRKNSFTSPRLPHHPPNVLWFLFVPFVLFLFLFFERDRSRGFGVHLFSFCWMYHIYVYIYICLCGAHRAMGGSMRFEDALKSRLDLMTPSKATVDRCLKEHPPRLSPGMSQVPPFCFGFVYVSSPRKICSLIVYGGRRGSCTRHVRPVRSTSSV